MANRPCLTELAQLRLPPAPTTAIAKMGIKRPSNGRDRTSPIAATQRGPKVENFRTRRSTSRATFPPRRCPELKTARSTGLCSKPGFSAVRNALSASSSIKVVLPHSRTGLSKARRGVTVNRSNTYVCKIQSDSDAFLVADGDVLLEQVEH